MDWSAGLGDRFSGWRGKKRLSGQSASPLLLVREKVFFIQDWRLKCHGRGDLAGLDSPRLVGPQASQQEHNDSGAQELIA
jgi:hypothetical protein